MCVIVWWRWGAEDNISLRIRKGLPMVGRMTDINQKMAGNVKNTKPRTVTEKINAERGQVHELRAPLLQKISEYFQCTVMTFYTTHDHWQGSIEDSDAAMIHDVISSVGKNTKLLLIISSPGGDPHAAERIIKICREWSDASFETLVPDKAKSAATMICLGSDKIYMTQTSELGPIDVQVPWGNRLLPAHVVIKSYEELMNRCMEVPLEKRVEPFLHQLQAYNAAEIEGLRLTRDLSKEIAEKVLKSGMMKHSSAREIKSLMRQFLDPEELKSHGRPIFYTDIRKIDKNGKLKVECIPIDDPIASTIHEYHLRVTTHMAGNGLVKLCETCETSFSALVV